MLYEFIYYVIPEEELNTEEIPVLIEWEINLSHEGDAAQRVYLLNGGGKHAPMREIGVAVKCESCGRWFNATSQEQMDSKCPNCGGDFYLFKHQAALDDD
jgi:DNA-directed RNA polymerase subunit RPC12/RpoP